MAPAQPDSTQRAVTRSLSLPAGQQGYYGPGADRPRMYVQGQLADAYMRPSVQKPDQEYRQTCKVIGATPNSRVASLLTDKGGVPLPAAELLGGYDVSLRDTYVGERGFIALLPLLDRNSKWTSLNASNNGLRNEAVLHLVDMLMRPSHANRWIRLDLSRNAISEGACRALAELVRARGFIEAIDISMTKVPRRSAARLQQLVEEKGGGKGSIPSILATKARQAPAAADDATKPESEKQLRGLFDECSPKDDGTFDWTDLVRVCLEKAEAAELLHFAPDSSKEQVEDILQSMSACSDREAAWKELLVVSLRRASPDATAGAANAEALAEDGDGAHS